MTGDFQLSILNDKYEEFISGTGDDEKMDEKGKMSTLAIILIVVGILVVLAVIGTIVIAGVTFLWASSFEDTNEDVNNLIASVDIDAETDVLEIEVIDGTARWSELSVTANEVELTTDSVFSTPGSTALFTGTDWDAQPGTYYTIKITDDSGRIIMSEQVLAD
jgi:hypothetical protein